MAARLCKACGIRYPVHEDFVRCPACDGGTSYHSDESPQEDWEERVERLDRRQSVDEKLHLYRLGVLVVAWGNASGAVSSDDVDGLELLAGGKGDLHRMCDAFGQGCTLAQALRIWL